MSAHPMYAVFLHPQAIETLGETVKPYLTQSPQGPHLICAELDTGGALCELLLLGKNADGEAIEVELILPVGMILLVVSVRQDGGLFGFRSHDAEPTAI